ncbi:MAG: hypothetical protein DWQ36_07205 [Acidobacteria bacterium]|nr:MAG: hypothetical protein DWQ30_23395 [Acidobacteriota bacterium]REK09329.1 MAG: hypothetical protein DWQ36_07205 [Acidobacteriota bacterium]
MAPRAKSRRWAAILLAVYMALAPLGASEPAKPVSPQHPWYQGVAAFQQRDFAAAEAHFREVLDRHGSSYAARYMLGASMVRQGRWEEGGEQLRRALRMAEDRQPATVAIAYTDYRLERFEKVCDGLDSVRGWQERWLPTVQRLREAAYCIDPPDLFPRWTGR